MKKRIGREREREREESRGCDGMRVWCIRDKERRGRIGWVREERRDGRHESTHGEPFETSDRRSSSFGS